MDEFIVYACPIGKLADQIENYFEQSQFICGRNTAHDYMPHCTLTGFFHDLEASIPLYLQALDRILTPPYPQPVITITQMTFRSDWHGLELRSDWLTQQMIQFAHLAQSSTRSEKLRLKTWLHLSFAYNFHPDQSDRLIHLAKQLINPEAAVNWEVRFYQRYPDRSWNCHRSWLFKPC